MRRSALNKLKLQQLQNICTKQGAPHLAANDASRATIIKRLLYHENELASRLEDLTKDLVTEFESDNEGETTAHDDNDVAIIDTDTEQEQFPNETRLLELRHMVYEDLRNRGIPREELAWLTGEVKFPKDPERRATFTNDLSEKIREFVKKTRSNAQKKAKRKLCSDCASDFANPDSTICSHCEANRSNSGSQRIQFAHEDSNANPSMNPGQNTGMDNAFHKAGQGETTQFIGTRAALSLPDVCAQLLPPGMSLETMDIATFRFMTMFDYQALMATAKRQHLWLHFYRTSSMAERSTKPPSATGASAGQLVIDTETGAVKSTATMRLVTRPIKSADMLVQCWGNLLRLEQKFRSTNSILRDMQSVTTWCQQFGWEPTLRLVEELRQIRMAMGTYDRVGLSDPEPQLFQDMVSQAASAQSGPIESGISSSRIAQRSSPGNGKKDKFAASQSKREKNSRVPAKVMDMARANGFCIKYQQGTCKETGDHTVANARGKNGPFTVKHTCALCKEHGSHPYIECPLRP